MFYSQRVVVGLLNSFILQLRLLLSTHIVVFQAVVASTSPFPISKRKQHIHLQGLYQCWVRINFQTYQLELVLDLLKTLATNLILILKFGKG
jgi:hypothetical protein